MRRLFWLGVGVAVGALVVRKLVRTADSYSPRGLADSARGSVAGALDDVRGFIADARVAMVEREAELQAALERGDDVADLVAPDVPADRDERNLEEPDPRGVRLPGGSGRGRR